MQFEDGVRIDLTVQTIQFAREHIHDDKLCRILVDQENILPPVPEATDADYHVKSPPKHSFWHVPMSSGGAATISPRACGGKRCPTCRT